MSYGAYQCEQPDKSASLQPVRRGFCAYGWQQTLTFVNRELSPISYLSFAR